MSFLQFRRTRFDCQLRSAAVLEKVTHGQGGNAERGCRFAGGVDNSQVLQGRQRCERAVVGNDERSPDSLQQRQVELCQRRVLADLQRTSPE